MLSTREYLEKKSFNALILQYARIEQIVDVVFKREMRNLTIIISLFGKYLSHRKTTQFFGKKTPIVL